MRELVVYNLGRWNWKNSIIVCFVSFSLVIGRVDDKWVGGGEATVGHSRVGDEAERHRRAVGDDNPML